MFISTFKRAAMLSLAIASLLVSTQVLAQGPQGNQAPDMGEAASNPEAGSKGATAASGTTGLSTGGADPSSMFSGFMDPFDYDPRGRRDPFVMPVPDRPADQQNVHGPLLPLQKYDLAQLRLVGIIWDVKRPKAMIKDPSGQTHVVGPNTKVGPRNGYIAVIREGEMVVVETQEQEGKLVSSAQVVKIAR